MLAYASDRILSSKQTLVLTVWCMFVIISLWVAVTNAVAVLLLLKSERLHAVFSVCARWAVQAELLTPLTFAQHRLSPLAAFTSSAYFFHNGRW